MLKVLTISVVFLFTTYPAFAAFLISYRADIYAAPESHSKTIAQVKRGDTLVVLESVGSWKKVTVNHQSGWVKRMHLTEKRFIPKVTALKPGKKKVIKKKRRKIRQRVARAAVGVKGLRESQVTRLEESQMNFAQLKKMESFASREGEAYQFLMDQPR